MTEITTTSTLPVSVDGATITVDGLIGDTEYDCRSAFWPDEPGKRPSYTTDVIVDHAGVADWLMANPSFPPETRAGEYRTKLVAPGTAFPALDGPDGEPLEWVVRHDG